MTARPTPEARERRRDNGRAAADAALIAQLHAGEEVAIATFEAKYGRVLDGFLREALPDRGNAAEVRQQVLLEIWRRGPEYEPGRASVLTWAMVIARSRAADERRRRRPEPIDPAAIEISAGTDPELDRLLERWRLAALLERIPAEESETLRLRFYEDLAQPAIAERTGVPLGTVKTRMVRGLARLRELLIEEEGGGRR